MTNKETKEHWDYVVSNAINSMKLLADALNGLACNEGKYYRKRNKKFIHFK
jgi:hypothetical protein